MTPPSPQCFRCPFLHRTTGDTERRYHLRYYKTGICIHETDSKGNCTKNGLHCAFAHGPHDLRSPVYDIRWADGCGPGGGLAADTVTAIDGVQGLVLCFSPHALAPLSVLSSQRAPGDGGLAERPDHSRGQHRGPDGWGCEPRHDRKNPQ